MTHQTPEQMIDAIREQVRTRTGMKHQAQDLLMDGIATVLGYWAEKEPFLVDALGGEDSDAAAEFRVILQRQADRVARLLGFEESWSN